MSVARRRRRPPQHSGAGLLQRLRFDEGEPVTEQEVRARIATMRRLHRAARAEIAVMRAELRDLPLGCREAVNTVDELAALGRLVDGAGTYEGELRDLLRSRGAEGACAHQRDVQAAAVPH